MTCAADRPGAFAPSGSASSARRPGRGSKRFLDGDTREASDSTSCSSRSLALMAAFERRSSSLGLGLGWWLYGRKPIQNADDAGCAGEASRRTSSRCCDGKYWRGRALRGDRHPLQRLVGEGLCDWLDDWVWGGAVLLVSCLALGLSLAEPRSSMSSWSTSASIKAASGVTRGGRLHVAPAGRPRAKLSARHRRRAGGAGAVPDLGSAG